jgi:trimeric autotransporter adhesin
MTHPRISRPAAIAATVSLAGLCGVFAGCSTSTDVSAIGNTPALYSHVYVTAQAVWFNNSATAGPDDGGWVKFPLSTPATIDLVADSDSNGTFGNLVTGLRLAPGTYSQIRLIPVDATTPLTASAQALGALYNMEADYVNASGVTVQVPLQILNPDKGIGVQASLTVPIGNIGAGLSSVASSTSTTGTTADTGFGSTDTTTPTTTGTGSTGLGLGSSSSTTTTVANFTFSFDGARDLVMFTYGSTTGVLYSSHGSAYDLSQAGGITGQLTLTNLTGITGATGLPDIYVNAELVTPDNSRHYVVASAPVNSDGSFTLYPLAINSSTSSPDTYDIVIHGPGIATIIIKDIQVFMTSSLESLNSSSSSSLSSLEDESSSLNSSTNSTTSDTTSTSGLTGLFGSTSATSTTTSTGANVITPQNLVSIGTLIPRQATSYTANITTSATAPVPAGAEVAFYQTLPGSNELPYVIERSPIDPINQVLATPQQLSTGTVDSGTFNNENTTDAVEGTDTIDTTDTTSTTSTNTSGTLVTVVSASPKEGTGSYQVAADAPFYAYGALGTKVSMPASAASASVTTPVQEVAVGALSLASGNNPVTVNVEVNEAHPGKYNAGEVLIGTNGQLVAAASLTSALQGGGGTVVLDKVPGGTPTSVYYVTVVAWNSANPQTTFTRQWAETPLNLATSGSASLQLTLD